MARGPDANQAQLTCGVAEPLGLCRPAIAMKLTTEERCSLAANAEETLEFPQVPGIKAGPLSCKKLIISSNNGGGGGSFWKGSSF